jgi:electron transport complex protein RnfD
MTTWPKPHLWFSQATALTDATTGATPLGIIKNGLAQGQKVEELMETVPTYAQMLLGERGGSLGEVAALAIIAGGLFMLIRKVITWHIPVAFIGASFIFAAILHFINPSLYIHHPIIYFPADYYWELYLWLQTW